MYVEIDILILGNLGHGLLCRAKLYEGSNDECDRVKFDDSDMSCISGKLQYFVISNLNHIQS